MLVGNSVCSVDTDSGTATEIASVKTNAGTASFFYYRSKLYLLDGKAIYVIRNDTVTEVHGYVPLLSKDTADSALGIDFEPRNLLCGKGRMSYIISDAATPYLKLGRDVVSIDAVYCNGSPLPQSQYTLSSSERLAVVNGLRTGDRVMLYLTLDDEVTVPQSLLSNKRAFVFGGINTSRPFLWDGDDPTLIFSSAYVSAASLAEAQRVYPDSDALYFPEGYEFNVGDGGGKITAVSRHYDRLLILTDEEAWTADSSACGTEEFPVMSISSSTGVCTVGGTAVLGSVPYGISSAGILRWDVATDEPSKCVAHCISDAIRPEDDADFFSNSSLYADEESNTLLFITPADRESLWLWSADTEKWVRFDNIFADGFIRLQNGIGFIRGRSLFVFDSTLYLDEGEREIIGRFSSNVCDFDTAAKKRLAEVGASLENGNAELTLSLDGGKREVKAELRADKSHTVTRRRITSPRFSYLTVALTAGGSARQRIHSLYAKII